jgi:Zn-finger nucleic acid-binding protein
MRCPACQRPLSRLKAGTVLLDVCANGCGGIWFDNRELEKVNREHASPDDKPVDISHNPAVRVDEHAARPCPRCDAVTLEQKLFSLGSGVVLDRCPECAGVWLDHGELDKIRETLHPRPRHSRAVERETPPANVAVNFDVIQQVRILHLGAQPRT